MTEPIRDEKNGRFAGSMPGLGKTHIPQVSRDLRLGYPVPRTPEVDRYLRLRAKYDRANASKQDTLTHDEQNQRHAIMMAVADEALGIDADSTRIGWEFYELSREVAGTITPDFPYAPSVVKLVADHIMESAGAANPESFKDFLPVRARAFALLGEVEDGYDLFYDEYLEGRYVCHRGAVAIGANVDYIGFTISSENQKAYVPFDLGSELAGLSASSLGAKPGEKVYYSVSDIHALEYIVEQSPKALKIKSVRYLYPLHIEL